MRDLFFGTVLGVPLRIPALQATCCSARHMFKRIVLRLVASYLCGLHIIEGGKTLAS